MAVILLFSLLPTTVFAAGETGTLDLILPTKTEYKEGESFEVSVQMKADAGLGSFNATILYDSTRLELDTENEATHSEPSGMIADFDTGEAGKISLSAMAPSDLTTSTDMAIIKAYLKVKSGATVGNAELKLSDSAEERAMSFKGGATELTGSQIGASAGHVQSGNITVVSAITGNLAVAITAPVKGKVPQSSITETEQYTGTIAWVGNPTTFVANTEYTANVTLTAKDGYQFAEGVTPSVAGADSVTGGEVKDSGKTLTFNAKFPATDEKTLTGISIPGLTPVAVPTAKPGETVTKDTTIKAFGVYDDGSALTTPVNATWEITNDPKPTGVSIDKTTGKLTVTNEASAGKVRVLATFEGKHDNKEITITKADSKETAIVATAPTTGTNITIPNGGTKTSDNCSYKVYDQYGAEMTGSHATWKMKLDPATVTGVTLTPDGAIAVTNAATTCTATLYAEGSGVKSNEITFNIARATSVATSLTITGTADSVTVPTVTEPGTTKCVYASYTAKVKDQYGAEMTGQTIAWSVTENPGVTINNGQLTVTNKATAGTVTITAESGTLTANKDVTINKAAAEVSIVKITAQDNEPPVTTIICTGSQRTESYTATVYDQYGVKKQDNVKWSLDPTLSGVTYEVSTTNDNIVTLKVAPTAAVGTFKLVATSKTVTTVKGDLEITVQKKNDVSSKINFNDGSLTYNGNGQKYEKASISGITAGDNPKWTYTYAIKSGSTGMLDTATGLPKIVGTYTVTATYEDSSNIGSKSVTLNITSKKVDIPAPDNTVYTYDGTAKTYKISDTADYTVSNATQTNANESGYTVTVALKDKTNTAWKDNTTADKTYTFKIMKAASTGEPAYTKITTSGKTLKDAGLTVTGSTLKPNAGTLEWVDGKDNVLPDTTTVAANTTYKWRFTPADANYTTLTGSIKLYHKSSSSGGGSSHSSRYTITVDSVKHGTITVSPKSAYKGDTVTITVKPDKGYELDTLKVLDKDGDKVKITEKKGKYTFTMPASKVTVKGKFVEEAPEQIFADVPVDAYCYEAVKWAANEGITGGIGNNLFAPGLPCTRGQIVTFLWRAAGSPAPKSMSSFADVPADAYYAKAVAWAVENGITGGTGNGKFSPDATCTRAQSVTFLYRAAGSPKVSGSAEFGDVATNAYYADAVAWAAKNGITGGIGGGLFGSGNDCTRAQIVTFLYRCVK